MLSRRAFSLLPFAVASGPALAIDSRVPDWHFVHNGPEVPGDTRHEHHWRVLRAALAATEAKYGPFSMASSGFMNESRQLLEMKAAAGSINSLALAGSAPLDKSLISVKVPVDRGLLGYRVFLIRAADQAVFDQVRTLEDLRRLRLGTQTDWVDAAVFRAADFKLVTGNNYASLFAMLMAGRFDALGRGVGEIEGELANFGPRYPGMAIEQHLLLHYPMSVYFWFPRTAQGERHAARVREGMTAIANNGTLDRLFRQEFQAVIQRVHLRERRVLSIANPTQPLDQPFDKKDWWFDPVR